jgi:glutamate dehydrogenase (NADP+)
MLLQALTRMEEAARHLQLDSDVLEKLKYPRETTKTRLMIRMADGSRKSFMAWHCRYDDTRVPTKGGIRFHPDATMDEVETLAFWMTFKCAVMNLPYCGGKGAVQVDPHTLSKAELERLSRSYMQAFSHIIGPDRDIPAPDVYTNSMVMGWMADEYASIVGRVSPAVITGKPIALGGSLGRDDATARGGFYLLRHLEAELSLSRGATVAIQGFGNAGSHMARLLADAGYRIVAVSDSHGGVHAPNGFDVKRLIAPKRNGGLRALVGQGVQAIDRDVLVPAALEKLIHEGNAEAVLPDILTNAGGVTVSYFEWVQNRQGLYWTVEEIHSRLKAAMEAEGRAVWNLSRQRGIRLRSAAHVHALSRLAEAIEAHGTQQFFTS